MRTTAHVYNSSADIGLRTDVVDRVPEVPYPEGLPAQSPDEPREVAISKTILCQPVSSASWATDQASQFWTRKPRTRLNSFVLAVTSVAPAVQA